MITNIISFKDGTYFNGVKGKVVRRTKQVLDAKRFENMSERDKRYLKNTEFNILTVKYSCTIIDTVPVNKKEVEI